jgi:hypothetical protein
LHASNQVFYCIVVETEAFFLDTYTYVNVHTSPAYCKIQIESNVLYME